jgi:formylglycine-generating enzyme required for sulfatase activity
MLKNNKYLLSIVLLLSLNACSSQKDDIKQLVQSVEKNMLLVEGGSFMMGVPQALDNKELKYGKERWIMGTPEMKQKYPNAYWQDVDAGMEAHKVSLSTYAISKYEVTWAQFDAYYDILGKEVYKKFSKEGIKKRGTNAWRKPNRPTRTPNWQAAKDFCRFIAKHSGKDYDLPSEAQWEYAARSRGKVVLHATNTGWMVDYDSFNERPAQGQNVPRRNANVGSFPPNPLGLYDMTANRREWIDDWYSEDFYKTDKALNPKGPTTGTKKILRGSSSREHINSLYNRYNVKSTTKYQGFRCVLNP